MRYSIEPKDRIYIKDYRFLSFAKSFGENSQTDTVKNLLIVLKNPQQMH